MRTLLLTISLLSLSGCKPMCDRPGTFRCLQGSVETCGADLRWVPIASCTEVTKLTNDGRTWTCQVASDAGVTACLPEVSK